MSRLRTYGPMKRRVRKMMRVRAMRRFVEAAREIDALYDAVDARSDGQCEVVLDGSRCRRRAVDHHHTVKPRRSNHTPEKVIHVCREHHNAVDRPYARGRLQIVPHGQVNGVPQFRCAVVTAPDKFTYTRDTLAR